MRTYIRNVQTSLARIEVDTYLSSDFRVFGARLPESCLDFVDSVESWVSKCYQHVVIRLRDCRDVSVIRRVDSEDQTLELWEIGNLRVEPKVGLSAEDAIRITRDLIIKADRGVESWQDFESV